MKRTVAIYQFEATAAAGTATAAGGAATADALIEMLTEALVRDGRFVVVERADLANIATEQQLGAQGSTTAETAAHSGRMIGASLIINGTVTKFEPNAGANSLSVGGLPIGGALNGGHALIGISLKVIDTSTGQVLKTVKAEGTAASHGLQFSTGAADRATVTAGALKTTPLGQAAEDAINKAVPQIALAAQRTPWSAMVIEVDDGLVYVNAGADENLQAGVVLRVRRKTKDLVDPGTGVVLETQMTDIGTIRIQASRPKTSTAVIVDGGTTARGDLLQVE